MANNMDESGVKSNHVYCGILGHEFPVSVSVLKAQNVKHGEDAWGNQKRGYLHNNTYEFDILEIHDLQMTCSTSQNLDFPLPG